MEESDDRLSNDLNEPGENYKREENMGEKLDNCERDNDSDKWEPPSVYKHSSIGVQWEMTVETRMYCGSDSDEESEKEDDVQTCHLEVCERNKMIKHEMEDLNSSLINVDENFESGEAQVCIDKTGRKNNINIPAYFKDILVLILSISIVNHFNPYSVTHNENQNFKVKTDFWSNSCKNELWNIETGITGMTSMAGGKAYAYHRYDEVHKRAKTGSDATHDEIKTFENERSDAYEFAALKSLDESRILYEISAAAAASEISMCTAEQGKHEEYVQGNKTNDNCLYLEKSKYILRHNVKNMNGNINGMPKRLKATIYIKIYLKDGDNGTDVCMTHKMLDIDKTDSSIDIRSLPDKCMVSQINQCNTYYNLATETCHITEDPASKVLDSNVYCGIEGDEENTILGYNSQVELKIEYTWCSKVTFNLEIERETHPCHLDDVKFQKDNMFSRYLKCTNKENENNGKKTRKRKTKVSAMIAYPTSWQICIVIIIIIMLVINIISGNSNKFFTNPEKNTRKRCDTRREHSTRCTESASRATNESTELSVDETEKIEASRKRTKRPNHNPANLREADGYPHSNLYCTGTGRLTSDIEKVDRNGRHPMGDRNNIVKGCSPGDSCNEDALGASSRLSDSTSEDIDGSKSGHFKSDTEKTDITCAMMRRFIGDPSDANSDVGTHTGSFHSKDLDRNTGHSAGDTEPTDNASCTNAEPLTEIHQNDENALSSRVGNSSGDAKNVDNVHDTRKKSPTVNPICVNKAIVTNTGHMTDGNGNVYSANNSKRYASDRLLDRHASSASNGEIRPLTICCADKTDSHSTSSAPANKVISVNDYTKNVCYGDKGKLMLYISMFEINGIPDDHHGIIINDCITVKDGCFVLNETFFIDRKIASGSYGTVYECTDRNRTKFALKKIRKEKFNTSEVLVPLHYAQNCRQILDLYGVVVNGPFVYVLMEFAAGGNISKFKGSHKECLIVIQIICANLEYLHLHRIVVYDLKAENMVLREANKPHSVALVDWGSTKYLHLQNQQSLGNGTSGYRSVEIEYYLQTNRTTMDLSNPDVLRSQDMWALSCTLFYMLEGTHLWEARWTNEIRETGTEYIIDQIHRKISNLEAKGIPRIFLEILKQTFKLEPTERLTARQALYLLENNQKLLYSD